MEKKLLRAAERIHTQYIDPPRTTDLAVLFLGSEGLYAEALRRPGLAERMQRDHHVTLTGPSTLAALVNALQMGFRTLALEKRAEEVWSLLGAVRGEFATFAEALGRTQKRIRQASESIEDAAEKSRLIEKRLRGVEKLGVKQRKSILGEEEEDSELFSTDWD
jgi:DNA recombination protein RmuC